MRIAQGRFGPILQRQPLTWDDSAVGVMFSLVNGLRRCGGVVDWRGGEVWARVLDDLRGGANQLSIPFIVMLALLSLWLLLLV